MTGKVGQRAWEKEVELTEAWRKQNSNTIGTTWTKEVKSKKKRVWRRITRMLIDNIISDRIIDTRIIPTKVSEHNAITWKINIELNKKRTTYKKYNQTY